MTSERYQTALAKLLIELAFVAKPGTDFGPRSSVGLAIQEFDLATREDERIEVQKLLQPLLGKPNAI